MPGAHIFSRRNVGCVTPSPCRPKLRRSNLSYVTQLGCWVDVTKLGRRNLGRHNLTPLACLHCISQGFPENCLIRWAIEVNITTLHYITLRITLAHSIHRHTTHKEKTSDQNDTYRHNGFHLTWGGMLLFCW